MRPTLYKALAKNHFRFKRALAEEVCAIQSGDFQLDVEFQSPLQQIACSCLEQCGQAYSAQAGLPASRLQILKYLDFVHFCWYLVCQNFFGRHLNFSRLQFKNIMIKIVILLYESMPNYQIKKIEEKQDFDKFIFQAAISGKLVFSIRPHRQLSQICK